MIFVSLYLISSCSTSVASFIFRLELNKTNLFYPPQNERFMRISLQVKRLIYEHSEPQMELKGLEVFKVLNRSRLI